MGYPWRVSQETMQVLEVAVLSAGFIALIVVLARRQMLTFRYTLGWFVTFLISGTAGLLIPIASPIAELLQISRPMVFVGLVVILLLLISIQLSISISGLQHKVQDLAETVAILKAEGRRKNEQ